MGEKVTSLDLVAGESDLEGETAEVGTAAPESSIVDEVSELAQTGGEMMLRQDTGELKVHTRSKEAKNFISDTVHNPRLQAAAMGAAGGGVVLGAGGAASGLVTGSMVGAALGVLAAPLTFGLSVPIGAVVGSGTGLCVGTAVGGATGVIGGGAPGYGAAVAAEQYREIPRSLWQRTRGVMQESLLRR